MTRFRYILAATLAVLLTGSLALHAIAQARLWGTIKDENGKPVPGVKITVTLEEASSYKLEESSNEEGKYAITLVDATRTYRYTFEKEGFQTLQLALKIGIGTNDQRDFEIISMEEARRRGPSGRELSPQERAVLIFNEGAEATQMGDTGTARAKFEESLRLDPQLTAALTGLATLDYNDKNYAKAAELAERARAIDAADTRALRVLAQAYDQLGDKDKAKAAMDELTRLDPRAGAGNVYNDGIREYNAGNSDAALQLFARTLEVDPDYAKAHYMLGLCLSASDAAKAREHFETFLRLAPDDPDAATAREMLKYLK
ncbi:MAG: tetratricopeptide repeat protein [Thermoanaerobaculia bacterium]|nr:MAG: tetratricopeptide repeat protein [Thermoanaerobaculia bacterium]